MTAPRAGEVRRRFVVEVTGPPDLVDTAAGRTVRRLIAHLARHPRIRFLVTETVDAPPRHPGGGPAS